MKLVYIAGKFTAPTPEECEANIRSAEAVARELITRSEDFAVLVPHSLGRTFIGGPGSAEYWYAATMEMAERCDMCLLVPGYETSRGTAREIAMFADHPARPIYSSVTELLEAEGDDL